MTKLDGLSQRMPEPVNGTMRAGDAFLERDHEQLSAWTGLMRRAEDLADRVVGAVPTVQASADAKPPQEPGFIGAAFDLQRHRDEIGQRLAIAFDRIERVL